MDLILAFPPPLVLLVLGPKGHPREPSKSFSCPWILQSTLPVHRLSTIVQRGLLRRTCQSVSEWQVKTGLLYSCTLYMLEDRLPFEGKDNSRFFKSWQQEVFLGLSLSLYQKAADICLLVSRMRWFSLTVWKGLWGNISYSFFVNRNVIFFKKEKYQFSLLITYFLKENDILPFCITKYPCKNKVANSFLTGILKPWHLGADQWLLLCFWITNV